MTALLRRNSPLLAILCLLPCAALAATPPAPARPHVLLILADDLGWSDLGCYGGEIRTPNLDGLARNGLRFTAFYNSARCCPTRASLLTGLYPHQAGVGAMTGDRGPEHPGYRGTLQPGSVTLAEVLRDAGYRTFGVGSAPYLKARYGYGQGFEVWDDTLASPSFGASHRAVLADRSVDKALKGIAERRAAPWLVFLHMWDVHYDYIPPKPYNTMFVAPDYHGDFPMEDFEKNRDFHVGMDPADLAYVISQYDGEVAWVDSQLGRLFATLREWGLYDNTVVVVTSDHGEELLDHGQKGHGHSLFDELIRVPLIVRGPGAPAGAAIDCPAGLIDLLPTLAALGGAKTPGYDGPGRDLTPLLAGRQKCDRRRELFAETWMSNLDKLRAYKRGHEMMLEDDGWKYHNRVDPPLRELLFRVGDDPREQDSRLEAEPDRRDDLKRLMMKHSRLNRRARREQGLAGNKPLDKKTADQLKELGYIQ
jgi:arylsulfatase A-like enzyme